MKASFLIAALTATLFGQDINQQPSGYVQAKINQTIYIPIEGRESRIDIKAFNVDFKNGCKMTISVAAEYMNLLNHRFNPDDLYVECDGKKLQFILIDQDGASGILTKYDYQKNAFVRDIKYISGVIRN